MPKKNEKRRHNVRKDTKESTELVPLQAWCLCLPQRSLWENDDDRRENSRAK